MTDSSATPSPTPGFLTERLCQQAIASTVRDSLPVLFFGDLFKASVATIGINPSRQEYLNRAGSELNDELRRFETLGSLRAADRASLTDVQAVTAMERMRGYFGPNKPVYGWFKGLSRVVEGMGFSFTNRSAAHLDLVQEATDPTWSRLRKSDSQQAETVLRRDLPYLRRQIEHFPLRAVVCTSALVMREVSAMFKIRATATGTIEGAVPHFAWTVHVAETQRGDVGIAGWNIPLVRPTGLDSEGQRRLGELLAAELHKASVRLRP
jgi:hypothetical protein